MDYPVLTVKSLSKRYGSFNAVHGLDFHVPKGKIIGLLGPNGAGKTTTIQMLLGITLPTSGTIQYFGQDFHKNRQSSLQRINFASAFNTLQGKITIEQNLVVFATLYNVKKIQQKIQHLAEKFEFETLLKQEYYKLSAGQKTRVNIAKSLLNDPELILMDEPTASLDPDIADKILLLIESLSNEKQVSILYTSHDMREVERICHEVIIMDHGKIVAQDTPLQLTKRIPYARVRITFEGSTTAIQSLLEPMGIAYSFPRKSVVAIETEEGKIPKLIFKLSQQGIWITDIEIKKPNLEDVFLEIARGKNS